MSEMLYKLYTLMDEEVRFQLRNREDLAPLIKQRAKLAETRMARDTEGELDHVLTEAEDLLDGEFKELQSLELFHAALTLGLELGRLTG